MNIKKYFSNDSSAASFETIPMKPIAGLNPWIFAVIFSIIAVGINMYLYLLGLISLGAVSTFGLGIVILTPCIKSALLELATKLLKIPSRSWQRAFFVSGATMAIGALFQLTLAFFALGDVQVKIFAITASIGILVVSFLIAMRVYRISYLRTILVGLVFGTFTVFLAMIVLRVGLPLAVLLGNR